MTDNPAYRYERDTSDTPEWLHDLTVGYLGPFIDKIDKPVLRLVKGTGR